MNDVRGGPESFAETGTELKLAVTDLEMRWLVQGAAAALQPGSDPADHLRRGDARITKQALAELGVAEEGVIRLNAGDHGRFTEELAKRLGDAANAEDFGTGKVQHPRRAGQVGKSGQAHGVGVPLPQGVEMAH